MNHEQRAKSLLQHYFSMIARQAGVNWDSDCDAEVADIVDHLIAAARAEMAEELEELRTPPSSLAEVIEANADARG